MSSSKKKTIEITVMTDYAADGLWRNGLAIDIDMLAEEFNIDDHEREYLKEKIDKWQALYESFDFWSPEADYEKTKSTPEFREFIKLGTEIAKEVRKILPDNVDVIYYDENSPARYYVMNSGEFILKEKYD